MNWRWIVHNVIAHPMLILCPPVGRWLHDRTEPTAPPRTDLVGTWGDHPASRRVGEALLSDDDEELAASALSCALELDDLHAEFRELVELLRARAGHPNMVGLDPSDLVEMLEPRP